MSDEQLFGCLPRTTLCGVDGLFAASSVTPLPRSEWKPASISDAVWRILKQTGGTCVGHGTAYALMTVRELEHQPQVLISPYSIYGQGSSNINSGLPIESGLTIIRDVGACDDDTVPIADANIRVRTWPANWKDNAANYRAAEWDDLGGDFALMWTMIQRYGWPVVLGTRAFSGAHCVCATECGFDGSTPWLGGPNSWGSSWSNCGKAGFWRYNERALRDVPGYGSWALRSVTYTEQSK